MTPAETLREAARLIRARAEAATPGPWQGKESLPGWDLGNVFAGPDPVAFSVDDGMPSDACTLDDATHIASWHPGVALAVADWLDYAAARGEHWSQPGPNGMSSHHPALTLARAYLNNPP